MSERISAKAVEAAVALAIRGRVMRVFQIVCAAFGGLDTWTDPKSSLDSIECLHLYAYNTTLIH